jgi:hypothetical protein
LSSVFGLRFRDLLPLLLLVSRGQRVCVCWNNPVRALALRFLSLVWDKFGTLGHQVSRVKRGGALVYYFRVGALSLILELLDLRGQVELSHSQLGLLLLHPLMLIIQQVDLVLNLILFSLQGLLLPHCFIFSKYYLEWAEGLLHHLGLLSLQKPD